MLFGELVLALVPLRTRLARGVLFGAAAHGVGTAKTRELGSEEGVVASLTMMIAGVVMVLLALLLSALPFERAERAPATPARANAHTGVSK